MRALKRLVRSIVMLPATGALYAAIAKLLGVRRPSIKKQWSRPQSILFSFPYHSVGDVVLVLPLLQRVHELWPTAEIDFVVGTTMAPIVQSIPWLRDVFVIKNRTAYSGAVNDLISVYSELKQFRRQRGSQIYDLAIAPRWEGADSFHAINLAYLSGAPIRCGYDASQSGGSGAAAQLLTHIASGGFTEHESTRSLRLLDRCGLSSEIEGRIGEQVTKAITVLTEIASSHRVDRTLLPSHAYVVMAPGATSPMRMWPLERFATLAQKLRESHGFEIVVVGSPSEAQLTQTLCEMIGGGTINLVAKTSIPDLLSVCAGAHAVFCNDSGTSHIAGAAAAPTFVISPHPLDGPSEHVNSPARFRPCGPCAYVLQPSTSTWPCRHQCVQTKAHCISQLTAEDVFAAFNAATIIKS